MTSQQYPPFLGGLLAGDSPINPYRIPGAIDTMAQGIANFGGPEQQPVVGPSAGVPPMLARPTDVPAPQASPQMPMPELSAIPQHLPAEVDALEQRGALKPETAKRIRSRLSGMPAKLAQGYDQQQAAMRDAADAQVEIDQAKAAVAAERALDIENNQRSWEITQANRLRRAELAQKEYKAATEEKIDPGRLMSGGRGVMAGIAIALGAIGSAISRRGGNGALDIINAAIDRDIMAQKEAKDTKVAGKLNLYNQHMARFQDAKSAELATRAQILEGAQMKMEELALRSGNKLTQANAAQGIAQLEQAKTQVQADFMQRQEGLDMQRESLDLQRDSMSIQAAAAMQKLPRTITGLEGGENATEKDRGKAQQMYVAFKKADDIFDELIAARGKDGWEALPDKAMAAAKAKARILQFTLKDKLGLGVLSESDIEMLEGIAPGDPTAMGYVLDTLIAARDVFRGQIQTELRVFGDYRIPAGHGAGQLPGEVRR